MNAERGAHAVGGGRDREVRMPRDVTGSVHAPNGRLLAAVHLEVAVVVVRACELVGDVAAGAGPDIEEDCVEHDRFAAVRVDITSTSALRRWSGALDRGADRARHGTMKATPP